MTRPELFATTATSKQVRFHDLRASGLTWLAIRGDSPVQIQHVAGHTDFATTKKYIDAAGAVDLLPGEQLFPALPDRLLGAPEPPKSAAANGGNAPPELSQDLEQDSEVHEIIVEAPGIEPHLFRRSSANAEGEGRVHCGCFAHRTA